MRKSRFCTTLAPAATQEEAREIIRGVRAAHPAATHHCYAYVLGADGAVQRSSDAGEPGGTAGVPMLQMLLRRDVRDIVAVVARYFGGTRLGAGGLIRAYGGAVGQALDVLGTVARRPLRGVTVTVGHERAGRLENDLRATGRAVRGVRYGRQVAIEVLVEEAETQRFLGWLADVTAGTAAAALGGISYGTGE